MILERLAREGKVPNFSRLIEQGNYRPLGTTIPPLSPVAWSTFTTGMNPGGHGIFDFVHRDPETMTPYLSTTKAEAPARTITIGNWVVPLSSGSIKLLREGRAFWQVLQEHGIPTTVVHAPANFPPCRARAAALGHGDPRSPGHVWPLLVLHGRSVVQDGRGHGGGDVFHVKRENHQVQAQLFGPRNTSGLTPR